MKPRIISEYSSERCFDLADVWDGRCVLLRSQGGSYGGKNIDLIFLGTRYIELPTNLYGLRITKPKDEQAIKCEKRFADDLLLDECEGDFVYSVESDGERYHVIASGLWMQVNTLLNGESPLSILFDRDEEGKRKYYEQYVEEWQKVE
jgi:hypothetical protein